ncbi:MAG TPA: gamma-glutamylcyclotransferase family protein [Vicinamibacterales bacterium]|nr:gamma-glutamylcyclotransferase family protein [Vicinamibacterales bacterium]
MPLLFSYGTLQFEEIQLATFGRRLEGRKDALVGYEPSLVAIPDPAIVARLNKTHHDNVTTSADGNRRVEGTAFEVTEAELVQADNYEAEFSYARVIVTLASGLESWLYVHQP